MINLITETEIKTYSTIDMNVAGKYLTEAIRSAQNIDLCQIIGSKLLSKLETIVESGDIELDAYKAYKYLLNGYIKDFLLYSVQENLVIPISYKFTNAGIMITEDEKMYQPDKSKIDLIKDYYTDKKNYYKKSNIKLKDDEFLSGIRKTDKFLPVITLVLYYGEKEWHLLSQHYD